MTLKQTLTALCLAAGLLGAAQAETVLRYSDHEPYGNMRTRFINDVFFKNIESESQGRIKIEAHWGGSIAKAHGELQAIADHKTDLIVAVPEYSLQQLPLHQLFKGFMAPAVTPKCKPCAASMPTSPNSPPNTKKTA